MHLQLFLAYQKAVGAINLFIPEKCIVLLISLGNKHSLDDEMFAWLGMWDLRCNFYNTVYTKNEMKLPVFFV